MDNLGLKRGTVALAKAHDAWNAHFERERVRLRKIVGPLALDIQHVGSTAIPGLFAKPIIDILMAIPSLNDVSKLRPALEAAGYTFRENGSDDIQKLFVLGPEDHRTHYLHITELGSVEWRNSIGFRDYLRAHPDERQRYEDLKQGLAARYPDDRGSYTEGKRAYVESIFRKAAG